jgi:hypothetical protein
MVAYLQFAGNMNERIVVVIKRLGRRQYQAHLRAGAGSADAFWSQHHGNTVRAKREAEAIFGGLRWLQPSDQMTRSEPEMMWIAYVRCSD